MKLPNGYGTIYKLSGNRRKPWIAKVPTGFELAISKKTGKEYLKQLYQIIGYFEKKEDAIDALAKHRFEPLAPKAHIKTLKDIFKEWSESAYKDISRQMIDNYNAGWNYIKRFEKIHFINLRASHFQSAIDEAKESGKSKSTCHKIKVLTSQLYKHAMANDICKKDYSKYVKIGKFEKEEMDAFNDIEISSIEKAVDTIEWADTIMILIYTGLRISEMLLLTPFSVDVKKWLLTGGLKTDAGKDRIIPIHHKIRPIIKKWYDKKGDRLICNEDGKTIGSRKYREEYYRPALEKIGVRVLNPHACRHTCATLLANAGADTLAIQKILGHANYSTTADMYTHTNIKELQKAIGMI